ncbi:hypothetical protein IKG10_02820 [Candidatus Saccharibacteria bacterium]|nr:hypothetical protein [Candidatus Saccharibacteria bacterium]
MDKYIDEIIKGLPKEQAEFLEAHRPEFVDYTWDHENWPVSGFLRECAEKYPDDNLTKTMLDSLNNPGVKNDKR